MMNEQNRLLELQEYRILDTSPEKELDELAEIASAICDTPISLVSLVDDKRQWFKAKKGVAVQSTPREDAFCQYALQNSKEVLVVDDPLHDKRFKNNPLVTGDPNIRFYAGAPLETPRGNVLGTLCVIDNKPRNISENQKKALKLLAKKVMDYLEVRKLLIQQSGIIELSASRLKKLSDQVPGAIYQFEMTPNGEMSFPFVSEGITTIHPSLDPKKLKDNPEILFDVIHPDDVVSVRKSVQTSFLNLTIWRIEYRVVSDDGNISWYWGNAKPEKQNDGTVVWYGTFQDITERKEYTKTLEQILFDISHVMRRPVTTMLGLTAVFQIDELDKESLKECIDHMKTVSEEMDKYTQKLNQYYSEIRLKYTDSIS